MDSAKKLEAALSRLAEIEDIIADKEIIKGIVKRKVKNKR